jgi:alcohol dehydrogenase (NADP+)
MGTEVTVLSTSRGKAEDAARLGAKRFVSTRELGALDALVGKFNLILDTVSATHDVNKQLSLLRNFGTLILVGLSPTPIPLEPFALLHGNKRIAGSNIGGIPETQEMLDYCGKHGVTADIELIKIQDINEAYERMLRNDVKYRFVVDMASLRA